MHDGRLIVPAAPERGAPAPRRGAAMNRSRLATRCLSAAFVHTFAAAARVRGGRPLHPRGVVLDATLRLHGTAGTWGAPFLDDEAELPGIARLSRSSGLPPPLPDLLGLALRWQQRSDTAPASTVPARRGSADTGTDVTAELLLATTGRSVPGRRALVPAATWAPAFYGSFLPYEASGIRLLLGAAARHAPGVPADGSSLQHAVEHRPLVLDLVVATPGGPWEKFGEVELSGLARDDATQPVRFDPARRPVPGLAPVGLLQEVRGPTYAAVQRVSETVGRRDGDSPPVAAGGSGAARR